ncbi:MAG: efflux RND transporter periplasmic adaptor subunit [Arenimonas sp.]
MTKRRKRTLELGAVLALGLLLLAGCGRDEAAGKRGSGGGGGPPAIVRTEVLKASAWSDGIEANATARARDSVTITATVSETVDRVLFESGETVRAGQVLVTLSGREQRANIAAAEAEFRAAQTLFARQQELAGKQLIAASQFDAQRAVRDSARARLEQMRAQLGDRSINAPFAGVLGLRQVSAGALVTPGTVITTLDDVGTLELDFSVPERQLEALKVGMTVDATSPAFPGETFHGAVVALDPRVDTATRALGARAQFANPDHRLRPGMLLSARVQLATRQALQMPELAVQQVGQEAFVFRANADGTVAQVPVTLGARRPGWVEIASGVAAGDRVVVEGVVKLRDGAKFSEADAKADDRAGAGAGSAPEAVAATGRKR